MLLCVRACVRDFFIPLYLIKERSSRILSFSLSSRHFRSRVSFNIFTHETIDIHLFIFHNLF